MLVKSYIRKNRRAVSPVIAVVLIIALTVAAGATVWIVVNNFLNTSDEFHVISVLSTSDYNNDSLIDAMDLKIKNMGDAASLNYITLIDTDHNEWYLEPIIDPAFTSGQTKDVTIYTNVSAYQVSPGSINFALGAQLESRTIGSVNVQKIPTVHDPFTVTVLSDGQPVSGVSVSFQTAAGLPYGAPHTTDVAGKIQAYLLPNYYVAKTSGGKSSDVFFSLYSNSVTITDSSTKVAVYVSDSNNQPLEGIGVYSADTSFNDLGDSITTNSSGMGTFSLNPGNYLFRASYLGNDYWSSQVTVAHTPSIATIKIDGGNLIGKIMFGDSPAGSHKLVRLYNRYNQSMGKYDYTNTSSYFEFTSGVPSGLYRIRMDYQHQYYWSALLSTSDTNLIVNFGGGQLNINVTSAGMPLPRGVLTRLYTATNYSTYSYDYLDSNGVANYGDRPGGKYRLRIDWLGQYVYTVAFTHTDNTTKVVDVGGGILNIHVTAGGDPLPRGVLVRLYTEANRSTYRYDYLNASGWAEFGVILSGTYRLRIDWLGQYVYTQAFVHDDNSSISVDVEGQRMNVLVTAGGSPLPNGVLVRLYTVTNRSTYRYDYLNASGYAEFGVILAGDYRLRVDWLGLYTYTGSFTHNSSVGNHFVSVGGGALNIHVTVGGENVPNGVLIRLYTAANRSTYRYDYLNASGWAEFGVILNSDFRIRVDWLGQYLMSSAFSHNDSTPIEVNYDGGKLNIKVSAGGDALPNGVLIRLYTAANRSTYRYDYLNASGWAEFGAILPNDYRIRVDWLGRYVYSTAFNHNSTTPIHIDYAGGNMTYTVTVDGNPIPNGALVRLYNANNRSTYLYDYAYGGNGSVFFRALLAGNYRFRLDYMSAYTYSTAFSYDGITGTVDYAGTASMKVSIAGLGSGTYVRLYTDAKRYVTYGYTDANGDVTFSSVIAGIYRIRLGSSNYSDNFVDATTITATFTGVDSYALSPPDRSIFIGAPQTSISSIKIPRRSVVL